MVKIMAIIGEHIILREIRQEDYPYFMQMRNNLETQALSQVLPPDYTLEMITKKFAGKEFSFNRNDGNFAIEEIETGKFVGSIGYSGLSKRFDCTIGIRFLKE